MRLRELELINSIMTLGSVSDAARANHMTQPNGSKMLKKLEEQFGFALFDRIHGRLRPREEMRQIWGHMEHTLLSLRHLNDLTRDVREMKKGSITFGCTPVLSRHWMPNILAQFLRKYPEIFTTFHTHSSRKLLELVTEQQVDLAIGMLQVNDHLMESIELTKIRFVVAMRCDHPLAKKNAICAIDLHEQDFIQPSFIDMAREKVESVIKNAGAKPNIRCECSLPIAAIEMVEQGVGISLVDHISAAAYSNEQVVFREFSPLLSMSVWLLLPKIRPKSGIVDEFSYVLQESAALLK